MGTSYSCCKYCCESFPDAGNYITCECDNEWCSKECAEKDGFTIIYDGEEDEEEGEEIDRGCKYCRKEDFTDTEILEFVLENLVEWVITRDDVVKQMRGEV